MNDKNELDLFTPPVFKKEPKKETVKKTNRIIRINIPADIKLIIKWLIKQVDSKYCDNRHTNLFWRDKNGPTEEQIEIKKWVGLL